MTSEERVFLGSSPEFRNPPTNFFFRILEIVSWKKGNRLPVVPESTADEPTRQVYEEVRQALGDAALSVFYAALAAYPQFLQMHWKGFGPLARSQELRTAAERLRASTYTCAHNYFRIPELRPGQSNLSEAACQELGSRVDAYQLRGALLLLLFSAQMQSLDGPVGRKAEPTPAEAAEFAPETSLPATEKNASPTVRRICREIRRVFKLPYLNSEYQALARWPAFLEVYWELLKELLQSPMYRECQYGVRETAWALARELPGPIEMSLEQLSGAGMTQEEIASVGRILELFVKNLSGLALNMAFAKILLEGGNQPVQQAEEASRHEPGRAA